MTEPSKICMLCGEDCSDRARVKDAQGQYYCRSCAEAYQQGRAATAREAAHPDATGEFHLHAHEAMAQSLHAQASEPEDDANPFDLEPDEAPAPDRVCPACLHTLPPDTDHCVSCGFNPQEGVQTSARVSKSITGPGAKTVICTSCGYDMTGSPSLTCPECGKALDLRPKGHLEEVARDVAVDAYRRPAIGLAAGLALGLLLSSLIGNFAATIPAYLMLVGLLTGIGLVVFYICCALWIGMVAPFPLTLLRYACVASLAITVMMGSAFIPVPIIGLAVPAIAFVWLLTEFMDIDLQDGAIVAILTIIVWVLVFVVIPFAGSLR